MRERFIGVAESEAVRSYRASLAVSTRAKQREHARINAKCRRTGRPSRFYWTQYVPLATGTILAMSCEEAVDKAPAGSIVWPPKTKRNR